MPGRNVLTERKATALGYGRADFARRREVLRETLRALETAQPPDRYHRIAAANLARWEAERSSERPRGEVQVHQGDWGEVTLALTRRHGACFAVLNMANAYVPGGGYVEGMPAQEENLFRRSDCHFHVTGDELDDSGERYRPELTALISGAGGRVYLDVEQPRVCLRGGEDGAAENMGYRWLRDDEVFPFFELRAAAQDLRGSRAFDPVEARRRIDAQLETLVQADVRYAVLSAFGCGAFANPADRVAELYRAALAERRPHFDLVAFAIFYPGYGPDNYPPFAAALGRPG